MTRREALQQFIEDLNGTIEIANDKPTLRMEWVNFIDALERGKDITTHQATTWAGLTDKEIKSIQNERSTTTSAAL